MITSGMENQIITRNTLISEWLATERAKKTFRMPISATELNGSPSDRFITTGTASAAGGDSPESGGSGECAETHLVSHRKKIFGHEERYGEVNRFP
jgi:hypothetical protein